MKPVLIISLIVLSCLGIGFYQYSRLEDLKAETTRLQQSSLGEEKANFGSSSATARLTGNPQPLKSVEEIEAMMTHSFELIAKSRTGERLDPAEQAAAQKLLLSTFAGLDHQSVFDLIGKLKTSASFPPELRENIAAACLEILIQANPKEALGLLGMFGNFSDNQHHINQAFNQWARANPKDALRWFEEESKKGNPIRDTSGIRKSVLLVQARVDPSRAMSHEQFEKLIENPDEPNLGASIAASLNDARENSAFLAALRHEQEKLPGSANLAKIRQEYIGELSGRIYKWTFEEASALIDSELSTNEKLIAVKQLSRTSDLAEPALWATWFSKINAPVDTKHPLYNFIMGWAHADSISAGKWLDQAPPGDLRNLLTVEYAYQVADFDPVTATQRAMELPVAEKRAKLLKQVIKKWKAKDPSAAAAFAKEHELPQ